MNLDSTEGNNKFIEYLEEIKLHCDELIKMERQKCDWNNRFGKAHAICFSAKTLYSKYVNKNTDLLIEAISHKRD